MAEPVTILGAGLAGCEAAWQLANRGIPVTLWEMKPDKMTPAHHSPLLGELVCSNSLRSDRLENAVGLLSVGLAKETLQKETLSTLYGLNIKTVYDEDAKRNICVVC